MGASMGYTFDDANRLAAYSAELHDSSEGWIKQESYSYDGDGRRIDWHSAVMTPYPSYYWPYYVNAYKKYEYVGSDAVAEQSKNGEVPVWYVMGADGEKLYTLHWEETSLTADVYAKDHLGSVRQVTKMSVLPLVSSGTRLLASDAKVTNRPSGLTGVRSIR